MRFKYSAKWDALIIFFGGLIIFTIGLDRQEILGFEAQLYLFAQEMLRHGPTWFPTEFERPYSTHPATSTFLIYFAAKLFGGLTKLTAVLPSAIASAATLVVTYKIGALHTRRWGLYAVGFLLFTLAFIIEARTISLNQYVTFVTVLCFYFAYSASLREKYPNYFFIVLALIFSFAVLGPIGLVVPVFVLFTFYLLEGDLRNLVITALLAVMLFSACSFVMLEVAYQQGNENFMYAMWRTEFTERLQAPREMPFYYYFVEAFCGYALSFPLAFLIYLGVINKIIKPNGVMDLKFLQVLLGWILAVMLVFTIVADKDILFILPISPALALACAYVFVASKPSKILSGLRKLFYYLCLLSPLLGLMLVAFLRYKAVEFNYVACEIFFVVMQIAILIARRYTKKYLVIWIAAVTFVFTYSFILESLSLDFYHARDFVGQVEVLRVHDHAQLVFFREETNELPIKYLVNVSEENTPIFISNVKELDRISQPVFLVVRQEKSVALPQSVLHVVAFGKIGHDVVVVFSKGEAHRGGAS